MQLLDSCFEHPIRTDFAAGELEYQLDNLPWARHALTAGSAIKALGTAIARNLHDHSESGPLTTLIGWSADPRPACGVNRTLTAVGSRSSTASIA